jgi:hypothetical protein
MSDFPTVTATKFNFPKLIEEDPGVEDRASETAQITYHGIRTCQLQTHVVSPPIPIPKPKVKAPTVAMQPHSCPGTKMIAVPSNKHSYIIDSSDDEGVGSKYKFDSKLNSLTITKVIKATIDIDSAIYGVNLINSRNIILNIKGPTSDDVNPTPTHVTITGCADIQVYGFASIIASNSLHVIHNGQNINVNPFTETRVGEIAKINVSD